MEENKQEQDAFLKALTDAFGLPWEKGEKPYFVGPEGNEWYVDKDTTKWAHQEDQHGTTLPNIVGFFFKKGDFAERVLMDKKTNEVIYSNTNLEPVVSHIDMLKALKRFD